MARVLGKIKLYPRSQPAGKMPLGQMAPLQSTQLVRVKKLRVALVGILSAVLIAQLTLFPSVESLICLAIAWVGGAYGVWYALRRRMLQAAPISTSMILGYVGYYFLVPPIATLVEFRPVIYNLNHPLGVFGHALLVLFTISGSHQIYLRSKFISQLRFRVAERIYRPCGYFQTPSLTHAFLIGLIGLGAMALQVFVFGSAQQDIQGAGNKLMQAMFPLAYIPFFVMAPHLSERRVHRSPVGLIALAIYSALLLAVATGRNSRATAMIAAMSVVLCYGYGLLSGLVPSSKLKLRNIVPIAIVGILAVGILSDLATSMVIVRERRSETPPFQLVEETLQVFGDRSAIESRRLDDHERVGGLDERYLDNVLLARLANLKFTDTSLDLAQRLDSNSSAFLRHLEFERALIILPRPVLAVVAPGVDKDFIGSSSGGDFMAYAATNSPWLLGGFRTGSLLGSSFGLWGWAYPLFLACVLLPTFALADAQTSRVPAGEQGMRPIFSPLASVTFFSWVYYLTSAATGVESFSELFVLLIRGWAECLLIYSLAFWLTRPIASTFGRVPKLNYPR